MDPKGTHRHAEHCRVLFHPFPDRSRNRGRRSFSLAPLTADEIRAAARILRNSPRFPADGEFSVLTLDEPPKEQVLAKASVPRRAFAVIYDHAADHTFEAIANLTTGAVDSWKQIPGAEPAVDGEDSELADQIVGADPRWAQALRDHGIRDVNRVVTMSWTAGYFGLPGTDQGRVVRVVPYYAGAGRTSTRIPWRAWWRTST
jgi:primary-amine oxidase